MRFVLAKGQSQYGSLRLHVDQMAAALQGLGHEVEVIDLMRPEGVAPLLMALSRPTDCYFTFNGVACEVAIDGARFERPPFLYASMHVDHPVHHLPRIASKISRHAIFFLDRSHVQFLIAWAAGAPHERRFSHIGFLPPGGNSLDQAPDLSDEAFADRDIDLMFTGTYRGAPQPSWAGWEDSAAKTLVGETAERMLANGQLALLDAVRATLAHRKIRMSADLFEGLAPLLTAVQMFIEAAQRHVLLTQLGEAGVPLQLYGAGWEALCALYPSFRHGGVGSFEETLALLRRARLVLNANNGFVAGGHERVFTAMLGGAAVLSDSSRYYSDAFSGKELATYGWDRLDRVPDQIATLLSDPAGLAAQARAGAQKAAAEHSWTARAQALIKAIKPLV